MQTRKRLRNERQRQRRTRRFRFWTSPQLAASEQEDGASGMQCSDEGRPIRMGSHLSGRSRSFDRFPEAGEYLCQRVGTRGVGEELPGFASVRLGTGWPKWTHPKKNSGHTGHGQRNGQPTTIGAAIPTTRRDSR